MPYPDLDSLTNPAATDPRVGHALLHADINEALRYGVRKAIVPLSSADILDLHNTPIELVAAPGAGKWLNVHRVVGYYSHGTTEYVFTGGLMFLTFGSTSLGEFDATANQDAITPWTTTIKVVASEAVNAALVLFVTDAITDGDGTLTVTVWYSIEDVPA